MGIAPSRWLAWWQTRRSAVHRRSPALPPETGVRSAEQTFESLYRAARALESAPQGVREHLGRLLHEIFEPLEVEDAPRSAEQHSVPAAHGMELVVPVPAMLSAAPSDDLGALVLRGARRGQRLFTDDDARLADRVIGQLRAAVAYDRAVEQGRSEERLRLAQDLHDDIGARLLTLMYKAPDPQTEEYVRHTLQDLKTLTRGLAAGDHLLSDAVAEWKSDLAQRLALSQCELTWTFLADRDVTIGAVHWSAMTRILRELVNNVIAHSEARNVDIEARFEKGELWLSVCDDGDGRNPSAWSHGLGLGGVRKRVKLLGGQVHWRERHPRGIACELQVPRFGDPAR